MQSDTPKYLTTKEVAELLRLKERKVYDLAADNTIPCTRATGKLLFSSAAVDRWLAQYSSGEESPDSIPSVFAGSHDPLLEWAVRESRCGLATMFDGSEDGLEKVATQRAAVGALHLVSPHGERWNVQQVAARMSGKPVVLVEWVQRQRGLIFRHGTELTDFAGIRELSIAARQSGAGSQILLDQLLREAGIDRETLLFPVTTRSEQDAVLAVSDGVADCTLGLKSLALQHQLEYLPVLEESFDLLIDRRFWFEPAMQKFYRFCRSDEFSKRVSELDGYRINQLFAVRYNA